jgi:hypothetical protein
MDFPQLATTYPFIVGIILPVVLFCVGALFVYSLMRIAIARGLRDHQLWMEKTGRVSPSALPHRESIG